MIATEVSKRREIPDAKTHNPEGQESGLEESELRDHRFPEELRGRDKGGAGREEDGARQDPLAQGRVPEQTDRKVPQRTEGEYQNQARSRQRQIRPKIRRRAKDQARLLESALRTPGQHHPGGSCRDRPESWETTRSGTSYLWARKRATS